MNGRKSQIELRMGDMDDIKNAGAMKILGWLLILFSVIEVRHNHACFSTF